MDIRLARYRFKFEYLGDAGPELESFLHGYYLGSAWRGIFGRNLKQTVCITRQPTCNGCALLFSCPYPQVFENRGPDSPGLLKGYSHVPNPYVIEPSDVSYDLANGSIRLGMVIVGKASQYMPYIIHSLEKAAQYGITSRRIKLKLLQVQSEELNGRSQPTSEDSWLGVYKPNMPVSLVSAQKPQPPKVPHTVRLHLITPLRLKYGGNLVGLKEFNFQLFFRFLLRRLSLLSFYFCDSQLEVDFKNLIEEAKTVRILESDISWRNWTRRSSRQKCYLKMGGLTGTFKLQGRDIAPYWEYLWAGQWTHLGKGCTMGLGRYIIEPLNQKIASNQNTESWTCPRKL